jgi:PAS domain S-box-containing protein
MRVHSDATNSYRGAQDVEEGPAGNPFQVALDAAEMGTWDWDTSSGQSVWSPQTYQLFGFEPGALPTSHDWFIQRVHPDDREAVVRWCDAAVRDGIRTMLEFRIVRADGTVRWVRSTGRAIQGPSQHAVHLIGVVADVTHEKERGEAAATSHESPLTSFSARQLARILGVAEATVKRIAAAGEIECMRSSRKDSRRFAPEQVLEYLRRSARVTSNLASAARQGDMSGSLVFLIEKLLGGALLPELLDTDVRPVADVQDASFVADLLARMPFIVPERQRTASPALVVPFGDAAQVDVDFARCLLRAHGHDVLTPSDAGSSKLADVADRIRARIVVLFPTDRSRLATAVATATEIRRNRRAPTVCLWWNDHLSALGEIIRIRSAGELDSVLRRV